MQDTTFAVVNRSLYVSFVYPLGGQIDIYEYTLEGKPVRKISLRFARDYSFPYQWLNYNEVRKGIKTIYALTEMFGKQEKLYLVLEKNIIKGDKMEEISRFLLIVDLKNLTFAKIPFPYGLPVYFYGKEKIFYSVSLPQKEIYEVKLTEKALKHTSGEPHE